MQIKTSHTQLLAALRCPWLYYVTRYHRAKMTIQSEAQIVGILVHTVIERFYLECPYVDDRGKAKQLAWLMETAHEEFIRLFGEGVLDAVLQHINEYSEAAADTVSFQKSQGKDCKAPTWTGYWKRKYAEHFDDLEQTVFAPMADKFTTIRFSSTLLGVYHHIRRSTEGFLTLYRKMEKPVKVYVEYRVDPRIDLYGSSKGGRLDLICEYEDGELEVYDFKTGRKRWTPLQVRNEPQLTGYAYDVFKLFGKMPRATGIIDCYNGAIVKVTYTEEDKQRYEFIAEGRIRYEQGLAQAIEEEGIDSALKKYGLPIGSMELGCPCNLPYEADESIRCRWVVTEEKGEIEENDD